MILHFLLCQTVLMFLQRCHAQFTHHGYQASNYRNQIHNAAPIHYRNNVYNLRENSRHRAESSYDSNDDESTEECECSCNECYKPKACCRTFCDECHRTGNYRRSNTRHVRVPYHTLPQSNMMVVQYAIPAMMLKLKQVKSHKNTDKTTEIISTKTSKKTTHKTTRKKTTPSPSSISTLVTNATSVKPTTTDVQETDTTTVHETETTVTTKKKALKFRMTRILEPEFEQVTKSMKSPKPKRTPRDKNAKTKENLDTNITNSKKPSNPQNPQDNIESIEDDNLTIEYYDYPEEVLKQKLNDPRCKDAANCYSRIWNKKGERSKHRIQMKSRVPPIRLRPTLEKPVIIRRSMAQTPNYKLRDLNDKFVNKLIKELKNKKLLLLQYDEKK